MGGLIWTYLGPKPAPLLPRWDLFVRENTQRDIGMAVFPFNWLQAMENSLDPVHVEWLHGHFSNYVLEQQGRSDLKRRFIQNNQVTTRVWRHKKIGFDVFEHGIIKRRVVEGETEDDPNWRIGHPIVFPNILRVASGFQYRVPMDDTHTLHVWYSAHAMPPGETAPEQDTIPFYQVPVPFPDEKGLPQWSVLDNNGGQDIMAWLTQGEIADRSVEKLAESDKGIILYRRMLKEQMAIVGDGGDPMNVLRDPAKNVSIELPSEYETVRNHVFLTQRIGQASKYSPVLRERAARAAGTEEVLKEPVH
jgi:5,5'-dehydrodivanillate O-demethylase